MRKESKVVNGIRVKAYAGCTGVLLAFNATPKARKKLLGFAVQREDFDLAGKALGKNKWLCGMLNFPGLPHEAGQLIPSNEAPIQKFRWSDYTVHVSTKYQYSVHPVYGEPGDLRIDKGPSITVQTLDSDNQQFVIFNRAVGASQAFARKFPKTAIQMYVQKVKNKKPLKDFPLPPEAYEWLSRGLLEQILAFIDSAKASQALDIAIYEFQLDVICEAVARAIKRKVNVRLLIHAKSATDKTTKDNLKAITAAKIPKLPKDKILIRRKPSNLMHDKFIVLSNVKTKGKRDPQMVLCGSTNFTKNGVYHQGNVVHITRKPSPILNSYLEQFERMVATAQKATDTKKLITAQNPIDLKVSPFAGFSPRADKPDLAAFTQVVKSAKRDLLFVTAFKQIDPNLLKAVKGQPNDPILRIGLQNAATNITGYHKDRSARFVTPAMLSTGLDGWLKENRPKGQAGNILIHTKIIVVDFTSENPIIISGSHNFTNPASAKNDENYLIIHCKGDNDLNVADAYGIEVMRLYDHYRFRWHQQHASGTKTKKVLKDPPMLTVDDSWTDPYFGDDLMNTADRNRFCPVP